MHKNLFIYKFIICDIQLELALIILDGDVYLERKSIAIDDILKSIFDMDFDEITKKYNIDIGTKEENEQLALNALIFKFKNEEDIKKFIIEFIEPYMIYRKLINQKCSIIRRYKEHGGWEDKDITNENIIEECEL